MLKSPVTHLPAPAVALLKARLHALYADGSKHAVYQNVPDFVREALGYRETINEEWRSDTPRYQYFADRLKTQDSTTIADVGANTGYFALNLARAHPCCMVQAFEPNPQHAAFIGEIVRAFAMTNISVQPDRWTADNLKQLGPFDTVFFLNILHHAGFDFDSHLADRNDAFEIYASDYLRKMHQCTRRLCFQIGSNRGGDKTRPLFSYDDDVSRLEWCCRLLTDSGWTIRHIGIASRDAFGRISYIDLPDILLAAARNNAIRIPAFSAYFLQANLGQFPGEFYRRPLFICEAG